MLTRLQSQLVRMASIRSADVEQFDAHVTDATAGRHVTDVELRAIVDEANAVARLPYSRVKGFRDPEAGTTRRK